MSRLLFGAMTGALTRIPAEVRAAHTHLQQHILQLLAKRQQDSYIAGLGQGQFIPSSSLTLGRGRDTTQSLCARYCTYNQPVALVLQKRIQARSGGSYSGQVAARQHNSVGIG